MIASVILALPIPPLVLFSSDDAGAPLNGAWPLLNAAGHANTKIIHINIANQRVIAD